MNLYSILFRFLFIFKINRASILEPEDLELILTANIKSRPYSLPIFQQLSTRQVWSRPGLEIDNQG